MDPDPEAALASTGIAASLRCASCDEYSDTFCPSSLGICWGNVTTSGASHAMHSHPNNYLSGVYYVQTGPGADTVNFHDPRPQAGVVRPPVTELTGQNTDQVVVNVTNGTLLMFPAYLPHSVSASESDEQRISVSFNLMFSSFTENMSKPMWTGRR